MTAANGATTDADGSAVRRLLRGATSATLATLDAGTGHPFATLVQVATTHDCTPVLLLSGLARHTRNLGADPRASLLVDGRTEMADPLTLPRATLVGTLHKTDAEAAKRRFLARHAGAEVYAAFADFSFWTLDIERAHLVAGFGRIRDVAREAIVLPDSIAAPLAAAEPQLLAALEATMLPRCSSTLSRIVGLDGEGVDLFEGPRALRIEINRPCWTPDVWLAAARSALSMSGSPARSPGS